MFILIYFISSVLQSSAKISRRFYWSPGTLETEQFRPVLSAIWTRLQTSPSSKIETGSKQDKSQFTPHLETRQNSFQIYCRRQSWLVVTNSVHTTDKDKTRQERSESVRCARVWHCLWNSLQHQILVCSAQLVTCAPSNLLTEQSNDRKAGRPTDGLHWRVRLPSIFWDSTQCPTLMACVAIG